MTMSNTIKHADYTENLGNDLPTIKRGRRVKESRKRDRVAKLKEQLSFLTTPAWR